LIYRDGLLAAIAACTAAEKEAILAGLQPPDGAHWDMPDLPHRPGRPPGIVEGEASRRRRGLCTPGGLRRFLHAIWHIEYEAIDLACLLSLRGSGMPAAFHADCLRVAREEIVHAGLLSAWLIGNGYPPGSEPVHHRLWDAAAASTDLGEQLVVVPRFLEARGLDVNAGLLPGLQDRSAYVVLERIYRDEIGHVATGTRWHRSWCVQHGLDAEAHFASIVERRFAGQAGPWELDRPGRLQAGFTARELDVLSARPPRA
jgi:uncharacterized ferritin-like protein (DUF455 family)